MQQIQVKKFHKQDDALEFQKSIAGEYYYDGFVRSSLDKKMDEEKNNDIPYMVDVKTGDIYYVFTCDDGLQVLNKFTVSSCISNSPFKEVFIIDNAINDKHEILIGEHPMYAKSEKNRRLLAKHKVIVTSD